MPTLEERVALLEQQMVIINNWIAQFGTPAITQLHTLQTDITNLQTDLKNIETSGSISEAYLNKLIDILYNFSRAKYNFVEYSQAEIDFYKAMQELKGVEVVG